MQAASYILKTIETSLYEEYITSPLETSLYLLEAHSKWISFSSTFLRLLTIMNSGTVTVFIKLAYIGNLTKNIKAIFWDKVSSAQILALSLPLHKSPDLLNWVQFW
ncbi:hypothetical protein PHYBLDRAFT_72011 [Phycomyces blakesleeanus NRRL 1555(-)]|uniref:Uncharacterized protein n=1 Tax=Phycomyces blakesleeanus (strain ATCC 8743b / DSM 1359 / FGSC 10004 / NBRC 33097 / NRRL 1555) TaxID=763407 RepID=A0A162XJ25_PHYB8|nr:hypothetical protein PHYBLDRAFT_72011 [Phycomyces blakesleeanus NRRL 1555(-)]OAD75225.1 hypothetical protein PHYBLDRAFT_72011 [Phycomyces blakesleeanus NRRL 1555(-)]|eukprot:XP_018293265.1 hypothetical protein PHYBLDRAFT_72011 [Phycomyces blakesleeanus NRRL 1555(-)]